MDRPACQLILTRTQILVYMSFRETIKREMEVAFSKKTQSVPVRILKYIIIGIILYLFRGNRLFLVIFISLIVLALVLHFWVRYKTKGWTKSYGRWKHESDEDKKSVD
jgi:hypothetical protein